MVEKPRYTSAAAKAARKAGARLALLTRLYDLTDRLAAHADRAEIRVRLQDVLLAYRESGLRDALLDLHLRNLLSDVNAPRGWVDCDYYARQLTLVVDRLAEP